MNLPLPPQTIIQSQSPQIGSSLLIKDERVQFFGELKSQSPQIGSSLLMNEPAKPPKKQYTVSIPSNRVFSSDLVSRVGTCQTRLVSIPSNRVFSSDYFWTWSCLLISQSQSPQIGSSLLIKGGRIMIAIQTSLNPLKSGLLFWCNITRRRDTGYSKVSIPSNRVFSSDYGYDHA